MLSYGESKSINVVKYEYNESTSNSFEYEQRRLRDIKIIINAYNEPIMWVWFDFALFFLILSADLCYTPISLFVAKHTDIANEANASEVGCINK